MTKHQWLRRAEYCLLIFVPWALGQSADWPTDWLELLLLFAWCALPIFLRPLTTPGISAQNRYAVCGLIVGAGLAWFMFLTTATYGEFVPLGSLLNPGAMSVLVIVGLLTLAGYLRMGWAKQGATREEVRRDK